MKYLTILMAFFIFAPNAHAEHLCFSAVKEFRGDKGSTKRTFWQAFDYKVQVDDGPIVVPSDSKSMKYEIYSDSPMVKIYLGDKIVESFRVKQEWLKEGRNCIYFKNRYETWSVVEKWQANKLCNCNN